MITAKDILAEAKDLLGFSGVGTCETRLRTVISRSYYAAYHHMLAHNRVTRHAATEPKKPTTGTHQAFFDCLANIRDRDVDLARQILMRLYKYRKRADYMLEVNLPTNKARRCCRDAENLIQVILP